ncbi:hypothetical protein [Methanimicrococcus hongohii]|uniref:hypothetical protein n=1 Tax=Methanimicrococcus hongohii TaxID=3028295 RepID=UPI00292E7E17|nr:hypothetical protein [Methanimicrococcus sp. Hf6]
MNAEDGWEEIDIEIDLDEINEILEEKINSKKRAWKEKEAHYADMINAYRKEKKEKKENKKAKKKAKGKKLSQNERYIVYGAAAAFAAYAAYHLLHKK